MKKDREHDSWTENDEKRWMRDLGQSGLLMIVFVAVLVVYYFVK